MSTALTPVKASTPVTPAAQKQQQPPQQATPTGSWRHPKFDEITKRQYATKFDEGNVRTIIFNGSLLVASFAARGVVNQLTMLRFLTNPAADLWNSVPYNTWAVLLIRLTLLFNIAQALLPLARRLTPDTIADIPLTPSQRQAMGLDPNIATPQTPGSAYASPNYVTPPRYAKSTPRSSFGTPSEQQRMSVSPRSGSPRGGGLAKSTSNSPFSPRTGSPLFQKAVGGGSATRRLSYDTRNSPLGGSLFGESGVGNAPGTPTPGTGKASVGLNNKWLYEKRRDSPRSGFFN
ncbi:hypothetical protein EJ04DRAFT_504529 [Polyplosphaeria fusca]|uniref:Uncharacterized protein n=1 Tax=Polyplosphaeria fusca TaxID=682080 RepID=A0A9P4UWQ8_9PLEO|nr:hypothetical protein EJ04DRAFT_504529 [Polyplosphaeria fusca]